MRAHSALSHLRTQTRDSNHIDRLQRLLTCESLAPDAELHLRHALAKELDDIGRYEESFAQLERGRKRKRATLHYECNRDRAVFEAAMQAFDDDVLPPPAATHDTGPPAVAGAGQSGAI